MNNEIEREAERLRLLTQCCGWNPSWIRPRRLTRAEVNNACEQAYHHLHVLLETEPGPQPILDELKQLREELQRTKCDLGNANRDSLDYKKAYENEFQSAKQRLETILCLQGEIVEIKEKMARAEALSTELREENARLREKR